MNSIQPCTTFQLANSSSLEALGDSLCPVCAGFDHGFITVQNGPELGHLICILSVTFARNFTGEMQI
jgi:hypothetical protein